MPHFGEKRWSRFVPMNAKIADITHPDVLKHFLDLEAALGETRKIIAVILGAWREVGTGEFRIYPDEGTSFMLCRWDTSNPTIVIADGTQRLQYAQSVANDDWDIICFGYVVEV